MTQRQTNAVGGRDPDCRSAAHNKAPDRIPHLLYLAALNVRYIERQEGLVQQLKPRVGPRPPGEGRVRRSIENGFVSVAIKP